MSLSSKDELFSQEKPRVVPNLITPRTLVATILLCFTSSAFLHSPKVVPYSICLPLFDLSHIA